MPLVVGRSFSLHFTWGCLIFVDLVYYRQPPLSLPPSLFGLFLSFAKDLLIICIVPLWFFRIDWVIETNYWLCISAWNGLFSYFSYFWLLLFWRNGLSIEIFMPLVTFTVAFMLLVEWGVSNKRLCPLWFCAYFLSFHKFLQDISFPKLWYALWFSRNN